MTVPYGFANQAVSSSRPLKTNGLSSTDSLFVAAAPMRLPLPLSPQRARISQMESSPATLHPNNFCSPVKPKIFMELEGGKTEEVSIKSEGERSRLLKAGHYCLSSYAEHYDEVSLGKKIHTALTLKEQFPQLSDQSAEKMEKLMKKTDVRLHVDAEMGGLVFVARGTGSKGDMIQDAITGFGGEGFKYSNLTKLVYLMKTEGIVPDTFTGHSLGGGMAMAASKGFANKNSETIVFDAQALTHSQTAKFYALGGSDAKDLNIRNFRIKSPLSLGSMMRTMPYFEQPTNTIRLQKSGEHKRNPINELTDNHGVTTIMEAIKDIKLAA
jgi:hypothetical protein